MSFKVVPIEAENYKGRQWGYVIRRGRVDQLYVTTGGTRPCWNIMTAIDKRAEDVSCEEAPILHVCSLDDLIGALQALRDSSVYAECEERWT